MRYNKVVVLAYFRGLGLPEPELEFKFHPTRKWRFDFCWPFNYLNTEVYSGKREALDELAKLAHRPVALEVEGGVWIGGGHNRGAGFVKDMEKYNEAAALGWRIIRVQPKDLCTADTANLIKRCLGLI